MYVLLGEVYFCEFIFYYIVKDYLFSAIGGDVFWICISCMPDFPFLFKKEEYLYKQTSKNS